MLLYVLPSQFLAPCCCICLCQNWSCDLAAAFADVKDLCYASALSVTKEFCFVWPMIPIVTFLNRSAPVSCHAQQYWKNLQIFLQQTFIPWTQYICWGVLREFFTSFQDKETSIDDNLHFRFDWYHVLNSLQMTFPVFSPISRYEIFQYVYQLQ